MRIAYSGASALALPLEDELAVVSATGYEAVELWLPKVWPVLEDLKRCPPRSIALLRLGDAPSGEREALRDGHRLPPGEGVAPLCALIGIVRALRADVPVMVQAQQPAERTDPASWAGRLRERALALVHAAELAPRG